MKKHSEVTIQNRDNIVKIDSHYTLESALKFLQAELPIKLKEYYDNYNTLVKNKHLTDSSEEVIEFRKQIESLKPLMFFINDRATMARFFLENPTSYANSIHDRVKEVEEKKLALTKLLGDDFAQ